MESLDIYCANYLQAWDQHATVRGFEHFDLAEHAGALERLPLDLAPLAQQPIITERGEETQQRYVRQVALGFLHSIATTETEVVSRISTRVANKHGLFDLSFSTRQVLLSIATDEVYHSFMARHYMEQFRVLTGESYALEDEDSSFERGAALLRRERPEHAERLEILLVCLIENTITQDLVDLQKRIDRVNPMHRILSEHLIDEGRHSGFFSRLLGECWRQLEPDERSAFAEVLPRYLAEVNADSTAFRNGVSRLLMSVGVPGDEAAACADRLPALERATSPFWMNNRRALAQARMLECAPVRERLVEQGWISGD